MEFKKTFCSFLMLFFTFTAFPIDLPETLTQDAKISLVNIDYNDYFKSFFSKTGLRIFDKNLGIDCLIDFSSFDDFDSNLFLFKFYFVNSPAKIRAYPYTKFISENKNISISDSTLDLSTEEIQYIYDFIYKILITFPEYSYDYDILNNNSYTHISAILSDCQKKFNTTYRSFVNNSRTLSLSNHLLSKNILTDLYKSKINELNLPDYKLSLLSYDIRLLVILIFFIILYLASSIYQTIVIFKISRYKSSVYTLINSLDFALLFFTGIAGCLILFQDVFSSQNIFRNNFQFLFLNPVNLFMALKIYFPFESNGFKKIYWPLTIVLTLFYFICSILIQREFPLTEFLVALPLIFRAIYFSLFEFLRKKIVIQWMHIPEEI